jgi:ubiquinone/menaquinone biosynthesis C-methylase UbiE
MRGLSVPGRNQAVRRTPEQLQHDFYTATAEQYDEQFVHEGDEHSVALGFISVLIEGHGYRSLLDVGAGTGRGVKHFLDGHDQLDVRGVEPVRAMIEQAERNHQVPTGCITESRGNALPFDDDTFDAVCEFGVLHHVPRPNAIVAEMTRVARRAVFLSDENRFGRGRAIARFARLALYQAGLWPLAYRLRHGGKPYHLTEGDGGVAYSYSVYDSLGQLNEWADRVFVVPTVSARHSWGHPLLGASHAVLCALKDR